MWSSSSAIPSRSGLAESLARPGGNVTGLTAFGSDLGGKRLELLKEISPRITRVGAIWNPTVPDKVIEWIETERAARALGMRLLSLEVKSAGEFDAAYATARRLRVEAIIVFGLPLMSENSPRTAAFANDARIPAIFPWRETVEAGGLMSLGPSINDNYHRAAGYVDKILKGARPAELPIEQPVKLEMYVNAKTARSTRHQNSQLDSRARRQGDRVNNRRKLICCTWRGCDRSAVRFFRAAAGQSLARGFPVTACRPDSLDSDIYGAFLQGMRELGYVEGKNLVIEWRFAEGKNERLPGLAAELVQLKVDVIVTARHAATIAAQKATATIPIVMGSAGDPVGSGFVKSLAQPGGNITGLSNISGDIGPKHLEMLLSMVPKLSRVAVLMNPPTRPMPRF